MEETIIIFEKAIKNYDFVKELLPGIDKIMKMYNELSSQLKENDSLEVKLSTEKISDKYGDTEKRCPTIEIILNRNGEKPKTIVYYNAGINNHPYHMNLYVNDTIYAINK